ncbi:Diguanylate cyclase [Thermotoga neapolitana DSM 4359]|uniref:Diguanylate cyclase n=1 Tax=Thermotoga neapolitana (strain ATCC 49049 / DSM 4359 / NBRC 107923 / NS-E) TaxID=309803 RepID=B9K9C9_THENN|nr:Diguanylate cyclase [Thermotoga neapolitana DSM 4359]
MLKITAYFKYHFPSFAVSFLLFLLVFSLFFSITKVNGFLIESWVLENERGEIGSTFQKFSKEPFTVFLAARISRDEVPFPGPLYLYIPQMYHSYLAVFVDGVKIGSHGFVDKRSGYFWNWPLIFELPEKFSEITLEISGMYRVGTETGVYIVPSSETGKYMVLSFMVRVLIPITIGLSLAIGTVMFLLSNSLSSKERRIYMYLGIASVLGAVWLFDLIDFSDMNSSLSLLLFRKATISSAYFAFFFLLLGFSGILSKERKGFVDWVILVLNLIASVVLWMAPDLITMERFISSIAFVLIVNTIYLIFHLHRIQSRSSTWFCFVFHNVCFKRCPGDNFSSERYETHLQPWDGGNVHRFHLLSGHTLQRSIDKTHHCPHEKPDRSTDRCIQPGNFRGNSTE